MAYRARATFRSSRPPKTIIRLGDWIEDDIYGRELVRARLAEFVPDALAPPERAAHTSAPEIAAGKPKAAGRGAPSASLPAALRSPEKIATSSDAGAPLTARRHRRPPPTLTTREADLLPPADDASGSLTPVSD